jgi:hypothetical protein
VDKLYYHAICIIAKLRTPERERERERERDERETRER